MFEAFNGLYQLMYYWSGQSFDREFTGRDNGAASTALGRTLH
jgi:hypothetical protein